VSSFGTKRFSPGFALYNPYFQWKNEDAGGTCVPEHVSVFLAQGDSAMRTTAFLRPCMISAPQLLSLFHVTPTAVAVNERVRAALLDTVLAKDYGMQKVLEVWLNR
jgi:hypothetical protein